MSVLLARFMREAVKFLNAHFYLELRKENEALGTTIY